MLSTQFLLKNTLAKNVSKQGLALFSLELANNYSTISKAMICEKHGKPKDVLGYYFVTIIILYLFLYLYLYLYLYFIINKLKLILIINYKL